MPGRLPIARGLLAAACLLGFAAASAAQTAARSQSEPTSVADEAHWSTDDIKDVTEMAYFISMVIGTAIGIYWLLVRYPPTGRRGVPLEFAVDAVSVGVQGSTRLIEVVATVHNRGHARAELADFRFTLSAVRLANDAMGPLATTGGLQPLFESRWAGPLAFVDPGVAARFACPASISSAMMHVLIVGHLRAADSRAIQEVSKLIAL
jgi:hypothetical protein